MILLQSVLFILLNFHKLVSVSCVLRSVEGTSILNSNMKIASFWILLMFKAVSSFVQLPFGNDIASISSLHFNELNFYKLVSVSCVSCLFEEGLQSWTPKRRASFWILWMFKQSLILFFNIQFLSILFKLIEKRMFFCYFFLSILSCETFSKTTWLRLVST